MKRVFVFLAALLSLCFPFAARAEAQGRAPTAENLELVTKRDIPCHGALAAKDPDGDLASFAITTKPVKGEIALKEDGQFTYTPRPGKKGRDYFGYRAIDAAGNVSEEATAIIRIEKQ